MAITSRESVLGNMLTRGLVRHVEITRDDATNALVCKLILHVPSRDMEELKAYATIFKIVEELNQQLK
jgi:hypothetical protein